MIRVPKSWLRAAKDYGHTGRRKYDAEGGRVFGVLLWNPETGEGEVLLSPSIVKDRSRLFKSDLIGDCYGLLEKEYEDILDYKGWHENQDRPLTPVKSSTNETKEA